MKKVCLLFLIMMLSEVLLAQTSSVTIAPVGSTLLSVEDKGEEKVFYFEFNVSNLNSAASVHIFVGEVPDVGSIVDRTFSFSSSGNDVLIEGGQIYEGNKVLIKVSLNKEQFNEFQHCSLFITDKNGEQSNILRSSKTL